MAFAVQEPEDAAAAEVPPQRAAGPLGLVAAERTHARLRSAAFPIAMVVVDAAACLAAARLTGVPARPTIVLVVLSVAVIAAAGLYRPRLSLSCLDDLPPILAAALGAAAVVLLVRAATGRLEQGDVIVAAPTFAVSAVLARVIAFGVVREARRRGRAVNRAVVVGGGVLGAELTTALIGHREYGLDPVGFLDDEPLLAPDSWPVRHLGGYQDLTAVIRRLGVQTVIVAFGSSRESVMVDVLRSCDRLDCEFFYVPRLYELSAVSRGMDSVWGIPLVRLRRAPFRTLSWRFKRVVDVLVAGTALLLLSPLLLLCTLLVRLEVGRPVFYQQERWGLDGKPFTLYKLCSLPPSEDGAAVWSIADDSRVRPVGRFLRRTSLDELPQLWNVLRGDMSLVGPRPERPAFAVQFAEQFPRYNARHRVPVGLTGWSQVHGLRGDTSISHRARFDNYYIENWSLWHDMKIMLRTFGEVARVGARR